MPMKNDLNPVAADAPVTRALEPPVLEPVVGTAESASLHPLLARRRSPRALGGGRVPDATLRRLLEAARWAPSSSNGQPWSFIVFHREETATHVPAADLLMSRNRLWAPLAPLLMVALAQTRKPDGAPNPGALYDLGLAVGQLVTQATAEGLALHQMGGFDKARARDVLGIPEGWEPVVMIAIGLAGDAAELPEELRASETAPRTRRPLAETAFNGRFGLPLAPAAPAR